MPRTKNIHQLKRPKIRQSWSKYNLFNLSRVATPPAAHKTFFQQKWQAKAMLRSYHNHDVREGLWTRMFDRRLPAVVPMDHQYLARHDGSDMAQGRGMGLQKASIRRREGSAMAVRRQPVVKTPYMHMTFWPLERRLDTAVFRAMFASSTRQARQFVIHGYVKVNGKKMVHPSYQLNPGDMFSVDPEKVMFATGAPKRTVNEKKPKQESQDGEENVEESEEISAGQDEAEAAEGSEGQLVAAEDAAEGEGDSSTASSEGPNVRKGFSRLADRARDILSDHKTVLSAKRRAELRDFIRTTKKTQGGYPKTGFDATEVSTAVENLETALEQIMAKVPDDDRARIEAAMKKSASTPSSSNESRDPTQTEAYKALVYEEQLKAALERARSNPRDLSKPYLTPWRPRDYMSPFAFIPRYLEVNQMICSAVYLRHPVARPGLAEVPTPFAAETMALGFNWYLRRR